MLNALLEEVLEDPAKNTENYLMSRATKLLELADDELKLLGDEGRKKKEERDEAEVQEIMKKHHVQ
jgi:hypothetical protein